MSFNIWKASAMSARECTRNPEVSSSRKKATSIASMTLMRVDLDHAILPADCVDKRGRLLGLGGTRWFVQLFGGCQRES